MKKLAIPAILAFWLVIALVAMLFLRRPDYPPHPPEPDVIVAPGNVEVVEDDGGTALIRITAESGASVEYTASEGTSLRYDGAVPGTPYHFVRQTFMDGDVYTDLVHESTGSTLAMTGSASPSMDGGWAASAGSHQVIGYSWVDIVELASEPELRVHMDAGRLGLLVESVEWTKSGDILVTAHRDYVTLCHEREQPELALSRRGEGPWTTWLDEGRSVSLGDEGNTHIRDLDIEVDGRYLGQIRLGRASTPTYLFDPDWTPVFDLSGPANPTRLLMVEDSSTLELTGWPLWAPEGPGMATSDLPCGPPNGPAAGLRRPITLYRQEGGDYVLTSRLLPEELGWSHGAIEWTGPEEIQVPGWVPGGAEYMRADGSPGSGAWIPTRTGAFVQADGGSAEVDPGIAEPVGELSLSLRSGLTAAFPSAEAPAGPYRYLGYADALGAHLVRAGRGDTGQFVLVDDATGRAWSVPGVPIPTPSGLRFATATSGEPGLNVPVSVSVFEWSSSGGPVPVWSGEVRRADTESIYWEDEEHLSLSETQRRSVSKGIDGQWGVGTG